MVNDYSFYSKFEGPHIASVLDDNIVRLPGVGDMTLQEAVTGNFNPSIQAGILKWYGYKTMDTVRDATLSRVYRNLSATLAKSYIVLRDKTNVQEQTHKNTIAALQQRCTALQTTLSANELDKQTQAMKCINIERLHQELKQKNLLLEQAQANVLKSLEQAKQALEKERHGLNSCQTELLVEKKDNERSKRTVEEQNDEISALKQALATAQRQNAQLQQRHNGEVNDLKAKHKVELSDERNRLEALFKETSFSTPSSPRPALTMSDDEAII